MRILVVLPLLCSISSTFTTPLELCHRLRNWGAVFSQETQSCFILYCVFGRKMNWEESQTECRRLGKIHHLKGRLANFPAVKQYESLPKGTLSYSKAWIGLKATKVPHAFPSNYSTVISEWSWFDGNVTIPLSWPRSEVGKIIADQADSGCMTIEAHTRWRHQLNDDSCNNKHCYYCEFLARSQGSPSPLESLCISNISGIWSPTTEQCFSELSNDSLNWRESYSRCASSAPEGFRGRLPVLHSREVVELLLGHANKFNFWFWTALRTKSIPHPVWTPNGTRSTTRHPNGTKQLLLNWKWYECDTVVGNIIWTPGPEEIILNRGDEDCILVVTKSERTNKTTYEDAHCNMTTNAKYFCEYVKASSEDPGSYCDLVSTTGEIAVTVSSRKTRIRTVKSSIVTSFATEGQAATTVSSRKTRIRTVKSSIVTSSATEGQAATTVSSRKTRIRTVKSSVLSSSATEGQPGTTGAGNEARSTHSPRVASNVIYEQTSDTPDIAVITSTSKAPFTRMTTVKKGTYGSDNETPKKVTKEESSTVVFGEVKGTSSANGNQRPSAGNANMTTTSITDAAATYGSGNNERHTEVKNDILSTLFFGSKTETDAHQSSRLLETATTSKVTTAEPTKRNANSARMTTTKPGPATSPASTTAAFPLSDVEEVAAKIFQTLGCAFILAALSVTLGAFLLLRDFSNERFLHMNEEIALLVAHLLIMTARDKTDMPVLCKVVSIVLHLTFMAAFNFLMLEALQTYAVMTSVVIRGGYFNRRQFFVIGRGGPALIAGVSALLMHDNYISHFSCWLNFDRRVAFATTVPICILFSAAFVMAEAASMGYFPKIPGYDKNQATAAVANQKALFLLLPLNLASWLCGAIAVHYANFAMYPIACALNVSLGIAIFVFHSLGNPKVHALFKRL